MRTSTAYFAGVGTVIVAVAAGLGGGYLAANIVSPHEPAVSKLERRMSAEQPIPVRTAPSEPVSYVQPTTATTPVAAPAQPPPQTEAAAVSAVVPAEERTASNNSAALQPAPPTLPPAKPVQQASEKTAAPQDAFAKGRDADIKRAEVEKRRAERRQRWADKRRLRGPREQELEAVEAKVREVTEPRQAFAAEPVRIESPGIRLFDLD